MDLTGNVAVVLSCMLIVSILYVCMHVCMCVSAVVTSMEVQLRYIEPFDIGEWQRMYRPELLDYSGILQIHPAAERINSEWMVPVTATLALVSMFQSCLRYLTTFPFPS
jgi:hypothetical protein